MLDKLATCDNNFRRVRILVREEDKMLFGAYENGSKEIEEHFGSVDQVLSRKEFLDRGMQVEVTNCHTLRLVVRDELNGPTPRFTRRNGEQLVNLSQPMFPRLAHAKALQYPGKSKNLRRFIG